MMKSGMGGATPRKRPRMDHKMPHHSGSPRGGPHHPQPPPPSHHDDSVDDIQEIKDEEDSNDFYSNSGETYEEGGWEGKAGGAAAMQQPTPAPSGSRGTEDHWVIPIRELSIVFYFQGTRPAITF